MSMGCPVLSADAGIAERLSAYIECQSQHIGQAAFQDGMWRGLPMTIVSALLTLYVASIGYRLILSRHVDLARLVHAALRLGFVVALTTSFNAYSTLIYTVSTEGPTDLAAMALSPVGLQAPTSTEAGRAVADYLGAWTQQTQSQTDPAAQPNTPPPKNPSPSSAASGSNASGAILMISSVGFSLAARLAQSIVLAVGPVFIAAALFEASTGLFIGWLRALVALFLAQTGYGVSAALELAFFAKDVGRLASSDSGAPLFLGLVFLAAGAAITLVSILAASALRPPAWGHRASTPGVSGQSMEPLPEARSPWTPTSTVAAPHISRAQRVSDAVEGARYGERRPLDGGGTDHSTQAGPSSAVLTTSTGSTLSLRRPGQMRASTGAAKRDLIS